MRKKKIKFKKKFKAKIILFLLTILSLYSVFILLKTNDYKGYSNTEQSIEYKYILVNKNNGLKKDYVPDNLVKVEKCSDGDFFLNEEASIAYEEMCVESINNNLNISIASAYRSYEEQKNLYNNYLKSNGKNYVDRYVAKAGYSEHQTGLAIDLKSLDTNVFKYSDEYIWIKDNSYIYGFILRYQSGKEKITGYNAEEWHVRYVGKEAAKYIYENDITYEEYYDLFILKK